MAGDLWMLRACLSALLMGLSWGVLPGWFHTDGDLVFMVIMCCVFTGYVSAAVPTTFFYAPVFCSFAAGISLPFWLMLFNYQGEVYDFLKVALILYIGILVYAACNMHILFKQYAQTTFEKLQLVDDLEQERNVATRATHSKTQFFAAASHDLRQPLNAINLFVDSLRYRNKDEKDAQTLDKISRSLRSLNKMLHSLLDISKLDASAVQNEPISIELLPLVNQLLDEVRPQTQGIDFVIDIAPETAVWCDPMIIQRILSNLIDNAVKFTAKGGVKIKSKSHDELVRLSIEDSGVGIPAANLDTIFDEFQQLNNPERNRDKGLGLGLSIVKRLCDLAGIPIGIRSEVGSGTTLTLELTQSASPTKSLVHQSPQKSLRGLIVTIVDDEDDILSGMQDVISTWGCQVITATTGTKIIERLTQQHIKPDLIISDLRLKEESGDRLIEQLREEFNSPIPAILITGDTAPERINLALETGYQVLYKPIETKQLKLAIVEATSAPSIS